LKPEIIGPIPNKKRNIISRIEIYKSTLEKIKKLNNESKKMRYRIPIMILIFGFSRRSTSFLKSFFIYETILMIIIIQNLKKFFFN
jgi:hypothetical protein